MTDQAGPSTRSVRAAATPKGDPSAEMLLFYDGVIQIGVDPAGRLVSAMVQGDMFPDEPLLLPGSSEGDFTRHELESRMPIHVLLDADRRVVGVQIVARWRATRVCDLHPSLVTNDERAELDAHRAKSPRGRWPKNEEEFGLLMDEIDEELQRDGAPVHTRPFRAVMIAGSRLGQELSISPTAEPESECWSGDSFVARLHAWFECRYGSRLVMNMSPGRFVVRLRGAVWECVLPRIIGRVRVFADRTTPSDSGPSSNGQVRYNSVDCVTDLTESLRFSLSDEELRAIHGRFQTALRAYHAIEGLHEHELARAAKSDLDQGVANLIARTPHAGHARWSALQAVEKILKLALTVAGVGYRRNHALRDLSDAAKTSGFPAVAGKDLDMIMCSAGVRYGEVPSSLEEAIVALDVALKVCADLAESVVRKQAAK